MGVESFTEGEAIIEMLNEEGFLRYENSYFHFISKGFDVLEKMGTGIGSRQTFVAMWFDDEGRMREAYRLGIAPGIRDAGYDPLRIDDKLQNGKVDDAIVAEIKKSRFLVADFTCGGVLTDAGFQPYPRGGVYYEAGLAHGLGMEVIFTCREDRKEWLHFDTRQFAHILWKEPEDLRRQLYYRIAATIKETPDAPGLGNGRIDPKAQENSNEV